MANQQSAFSVIANLVSDFKTNESKFLSPNYSEADVRKDFIDKFFDALGWDVYHNEQKNPYEQEAKIERGITIGRQQKRADYAFYIHPNFRDVKFFVEAKKPSRNLSNADDYFQACRYGWNAGTQITFLTDFEEFIVLDCRTKPDINNILNNKIKSYRYEDYLNEEKFAEIYWLISRQAVADNSLEKFAESLPKPKGKTIAKGTHRATYQSIDEAFLEELDEIRDSLAKAFKKANEHLGSDELTEMTQRTIDRLVFIRFLEDRQIEPDHYVSEFGKRKSAWTDFINASRNLDAKYNGIVFKKHSIDTEKSLAPDDKSFAQICEELAHKNSPYNFDIIPIHILGSIYERFLGKVVIATDKRVRIEEKPEVRKAGGVYYTPQYIVNYIVENTVGKLIEGKKPSEIAKMRFADISCGSGSFLITVFERVLEYHRKWYQENGEQAKKDGCILHEGKWVLSIKQKQNILLNNIYGVDLDPQAIEVTQLSLYLKLLEDETTATANDMMVMFKEQILPSLSSNIVCGNSLIGTDILENNLFGNVETLRERLKKNGETHSDASLQTVDELKLKPMNFEDVFPHIFKRGSSASSEHGFDAIVGNPPYVLGRETFEDNIKNYLKTNYFTYGGKFDLYIYFTERGISLLKENGCLSYIIPNTVLVNENATELRKYLLNKTLIEKIKLFNGRVFKNAQVESVILVLSKNSIVETHEAHVIEVDNIEKYELYQSKLVDNTRSRFNLETKESETELISKLYRQSFLLKDISDICIGIQLGGSSGTKLKEDFLSTEPLDDTYKKVLDGKEINNYLTKWKGNYVKYGNWLHRKRNEKYFINSKILVRQIGAVPVATLDEEMFYTLNTLYNLLIVDASYSPKFILAIINSKLGNWFWKKENSDYKSLFPKIKKEQLEKIIIPLIDFSNGETVTYHTKMIQLVDQMLEAKKQITQAKTESEREYLEKKCAIIDRQIDQLVYELYGLTEEEIKIVEGN